MDCAARRRRATLEYDAATGCGPAAVDYGADVADGRLRWATSLGCAAGLRGVGCARAILAPAAPLAAVDYGAPAACAPPPDRARDPAAGRGGRLRCADGAGAPRRCATPVGPVGPVGPPPGGAAGADDGECKLMVKPSPQFIQLPAPAAQPLPAPPPPVQQPVGSPYSAPPPQTFASSAAQIPPPALGQKTLLGR